MIGHELMLVIQPVLFSLLQRFRTFDEFSMQSLQFLALLSGKLYHLYQTRAFSRQIRKLSHREPKILRERQVKQVEVRGLVSLMELIPGHSRLGISLPCIFEGLRTLFRLSRLFSRAE